MTDERTSGLTDAEFADFNNIVQKVIKMLIRCADKHNIDRDSFLQYFADVFGAMVEISTFKSFGKSGDTK